MNLIAAIRTGASTDVLTSLRAICDSQGLGDLSKRLAELAELVTWDMKDVEVALDTLPYGERAVHKSARHLLEQGGKRLRPMCAALAARMGEGFNEAAREIGVAVELVHCATLLHDDVVDLGAQRRGAPAARLLYGNAASIFAGDWLLIEALRRVQGTEVEGVLTRLLSIIDEMISAESLQLERRGRIDTRRETYFQVVEGKTAALFRWAMYAGARSGGLADESCAVLESYGLHLGMAFQLIDDLLDYSEDSTTTGKSLFTDLREGKMTYPLIIALERDAQLKPLLETFLHLPPGEQAPPAARKEVIELLGATQAFEETRVLAERHAASAIESIAHLPQSPARSALFTVAQATVHRNA